MNLPSPEFISTAAAAQMLGLSTSMVQSLVDKHALQGWKTQGGHRRIAMQSIHDYKIHARTVPPWSVRQPARALPQVMMVLETVQLLDKMQQRNHDLSGALQLQLVDSLAEAMIILGGHRPDLLVVELTMPRDQQQKTVQALENFNARGRPVSMVLISSERDLMKGTAPLAAASIQLVPGPLSGSWLHAYLTGVASCRL